MSMVNYLRRATADEVAGLSADPSQLSELVFSEAHEDRVIDFDRAWHALHFLLTGYSGWSEHPLNMLVTDDAHLIGTNEHGFGGYWLIDPAGVRTFADALAEISDDDLASRYDPAAMTAEYIYMSDVFEEEGSEALPYIMQGVPDLRNFARAAADDGNYVIGVAS